MSVVLVFDLGGSSLKSALIDGNGQILAQHRIDATFTNEKSGVFEINPEVWWKDVVASINTLHKLDPFAFASVKGLGLCGFTRTQVFLGPDGAVLRPAITWQDTRAELTIPTLKALLPDTHPEFEQINAFHPLARLHWLKTAEPQTVQNLATVLDPKDFIAYRLTGARHSDPISMARLLAASQPGKDGRSLMAAAGLPDSLLPKLLDPTAKIGRVQASEGGALAFLAGKPVFNGSNDTWAAVLGLGAMRSGMAYNISGTTEVFGVIHQEQTSADGLLSVDWGGMYQLGGPGQNGAETIRWLLAVINDQKQQTDPGEALSRLLLMPREPQPLLFLPYLNGERTPYWDSSLRGAFLGLNRKHGAVDMAYAVFEGVAFHNRIILERAEHATGICVNEIRFGGGAAASPIWRQIKADVCGRPVIVGETTETGLLGAAAVVWTGLRHFESLEKAQQTMVRTLSRSEPDTGRRRFYDELFVHFRAAEKALSPLSTSLSQMSLIPSPSFGA